MSKRLTEAEVIEKCKKIHHNKYDYSEIGFISMDKPIYPICPIHGKFEILAKNHIRGTGCKECRTIEKITFEDFLQAAKESHPKNFNDYDYSLITEEIFKTEKKHLPIICKKCGEVFIQSMYNHMKGANCTNCKHKAKELKIKKAIDKFGDKFDFSKAEFDSKGNIKNVYCNDCHEYFSTGYSTFIKSKIGCPLCYFKSTVRDTESFIKKAKIVNHDMYDYSNVVYKGARKLVYPICKRCGKEFPVTATAHLGGSGCPYCNRHSSKLEFEITDFLTENKINFIPQYTFDWLKSKFGTLSYDFYLPDYNIAIECQGKQHFGLGKFAKDGKFEKIQERDERKRKLSEENGVKLLYYSNLKIKYPYFVFTDKEELLKEILSSERVS